MSKSIVLATLLSGLSCYAMVPTAAAGRKNSTDKGKSTIKSISERHKKGRDSLPAESSEKSLKRKHVGSFGCHAVLVD